MALAHQTATRSLRLEPGDCSVWLRRVHARSVATTATIATERSITNISAAVATITAGEGRRLAARSPRAAATPTREWVHMTRRRVTRVSRRSARYFRVRTEADVVMIVGELTAPGRSAPISVRTHNRGARHSIW